MISAPLIRRWLSWLFLAAAIITAALSGPYLHKIVEAYGRDFPLRILPDLPAFSQFVLSNLDSIPNVAYGIGLFGVLGGILALRFGSSPDSKAHSASLIALALYHVVLVLWMTFIVGFFLLPKLKAGI